MQQPEFIIVPPMLRIPQVPPQVIAQRRGGYSGPLPSRHSATLLQCSPLPQPYRPHQLVYIPPERRHVQVIEQSPWLAHPMPETPRPFRIVSDTDQFAPIQETPTNISLHISPIGMSATFPNTLVGLSLSNAKRHEPGVFEALMGCATLFLVGIILLAILYYIAV